MSQALAEAEHSAINGADASEESIGTHDHVEAAEATPSEEGACRMEAAAAVESQPESVDESRAATSDEDVRGEPATPELSPEDAAEEEMMASAAASRAKFLEIEKAAAKPTWNGQDEVRKMKFGNRLAQFESGRANNSSASRGLAPVTGGVHNKIAALQAAAPPTMAEPKKTWQAGPGGSYRKKTAFKEGVAPKKSLTDLP